MGKNDNFKKVFQFSLEGKYITSYKSIARAARIMGCNESTVRKAAKRKGTAMGFAWRFERDFTKRKVKLPKILVFDIETTPLEAYVWQTQVWKAHIDPGKIISEWFMLTWSAKWLYSGITMSDKLTPEEVKAEDDSRILRKLWNLLDEADIVIAHNGDKFDIPNINARLFIHGFHPPSPYRTIDTLKTARYRFGFTYNGLNQLADYLKIDGKLNTNFELWRQCKNGNPEALEEMRVYNMQDVDLLEEVYLRMRPWIKGHPNVAIYAEEDQLLCPVCGSDKLEPSGYVYTNVSKFPAVRCGDCHSHGKMRNNAYPKEYRENLIRPMPKI